MTKMIKKLLRKLIRTEIGQSLPMVLILMAVGGLIVAPLLSYTSSGLKVGKAYEKMADEFYAADAGIEDGLWQIKYNNLDELFTNYERYNYSAEYVYPVSYPVEVNGLDVDVTIENVWIPKDISAPTSAAAEALIGAGKLIIAGGVSAELTQQVKIYYYKEAGDPDLYVNKIGIWMPPGISYNTEGECTLETHLDDELGVTYTRQITPHQGGEAVVWTLTEPVLFTDLPGVSIVDTPMTSTFTFLFTLDDPESERVPEALSWITTSGVSDIPYTWDADVRVFHITSQAGGADGVTIDAYSIRSELRELGSAISGDYRAIGNTLMLNLVPDWWGPVRDYLLTDSDAMVDDIPDNAQVDKVYLYWSAWVEASGGDMETLFYDSCNDIENGNWYAGSDWDDAYWESAFQAHHYYGGGQELEMVTPIGLGNYDSGEVTISWRYWRSGNLENDDCLQYALYNDGGWSGWNEVFCGDGWGGAGTNPSNFETAVPDDYLTDDFKIKFRITGFSGSGWGGTEICYIDNIAVEGEAPETIADTVVRFEIDEQQVYFEDDEYGNPTVPTQGSGNIYAEEWTVLENGPNDYSYSCKADVTALVQEFTERGNATYTVGDVNGDIDSQWSYAGWSLIIIYSSPETKRHQLYLFDDFLYIAPHTDGVNYPISGFLVPDPIAGETVAATITCFVGDGDDYYSGDFIAINAPDGLDGHEIPNSYKLWDGINLSPPSFPPYMPNNSSSPNNVWNSRSEGFGGSEIDGVDIDTFYVPWGSPPSSGLIKPGDSSATISLNFADPNPSYSELINFIYIILSFRSRAVTGGTVTYLIEG